MTALARPHLFEKLEAVPESGTLIIAAPAGYGKTTLLAQCYERAERKAWLSLSPDIADPVPFVRYLRHALIPSLSLAPDQGSHFVTDPQLELEEILNQVARCGGPLLLCIDEYDAVESSVMNAFMAGFILKLPPQMRLIISCRHLPDFQLARLKAQGRAATLCVQDLQFTAEETRSLFAGALPADAVEWLQEQTEGWPLGLQLARLWVQSQEGRPVLFPDMMGQMEEIARYLSEQLFAGQSEAAREVLKDCSILERIEPALVDWIRDRSDSVELLESLRSLDPLLSALPGPVRAYRMHQLLARFFREQLEASATPEEIRLRHRRAAEWYRKEGRLPEALRHAAETGDADLTARIFEEAGGLRSLIYIGSPGLRSLFAALPAEAFENVPSLKLARCVVLLTSGYLKEARDLFQSTKEIADREAFSRADAVDLKIVEIYISTYCDDEVSGEHLEELELLVDRIGNKEPEFRFFALLFLTICYQQYGNLIKAERRLGEFKRHAEAIHSDFANLSSESHRGLIEYARGNLAGAKASLRSAIDRGSAIPSLRSSIHHLSARIFLAEVLYEQNDLAGAYAHVETILPQIERAEGWFDAYAAGFGLAARAAYATNSIESVVIVCERLRDLAQRRGYARLQRLSNAFEADLCSRAGRYDDVAGIINEFSDVIASGHFGTRDLRTWREYDATASAIIRWSMGKGRHDLAFSLIEDYAGRGRSQHRRRPVVKSLLFRAVIHQLRGEMEPALDALQEAVTLAADAGMRRTLLDEGEPLRRLVRRGMATHFAHRLTEEHRRYLSALFGGNAGAGIEGGVFSQREYDVLAELARGHSNKLIGRRLNMSENTVKTHLKHVFAKLNVADRDEAVAKSRLQGLLP